jgi:hypothetical protein
VKKLSFDPTKWSGSNPSVLNTKSIVTEFLSIMTIMIEYLHGAKLPQFIALLLIDRKRGLLQRNSKAFP